MKRLSRPLAFTAGLLWVGALVLPAASMGYDPTCNRPTGDMMGYLILLIGWLGPLQLQPAWYANPLIVAAVVRRLFNQSGGWIGMTAFATALFAFTWSKATADVTEYVCSRSVGFYVWLASAAVLASADAADRFRRGKTMTAGKRSA